MLEQTRGYLKIKGVLFGLKDKRSIYENEYSKRLKFGVKTSDINSVMITSKYWFEGGSLNIYIRGEKDSISSAFKKDEAHSKILRTFNDGDSVYVKAILDANSYSENVFLSAQLSSILSTKKINFDNEYNEFTQEFIFNKIVDDRVHCKLIDYKGIPSNFDNISINDSIREDFDSLEYGDYVKCNGILLNMPIVEDGLVTGKAFRMMANNIITIVKGKYTEEDLTVKTEEELIIDTSLMPWEV